MLYRNDMVFLLQLVLLLLTYNGGRRKFDARNIAEFKL